MGRKILVIAVAACLVLSMAAPAMAKSEKAATVVSSALWGGGRLWGTVLTSTDFSTTGAPESSFDILYNFDGSGLTGQRSISEAYPGMSGYNGGRWHVMAVTFTAAGLAALDMDGDDMIDDELTSVEDLFANPSYFTLSDTGVFFLCPLRKGKG